MSDLIEVQDSKGNRVTISAAHFKRWPSLAKEFRLVPAQTTPVVETKAAPAATHTPTGDKKKEN
jgi:hypothetical protein